MFQVQVNDSHVFYMSLFYTCVFAHFADGNQLNGFSIAGTLAESKLVNLRDPMYRGE